MGLKKQSRIVSLGRYPQYVYLKQGAPSSGEIDGDTASREAVEAQPESAPLIAFQVPNEVGLGHMNRQASVAVAVREIDPQVRVLFVVAGGSHGLLESLSLPYVSVPVANKMRQQSSWAGWLQAECDELALSMSESVLRATLPNLVVFDCFPNAQFAEAAAALAIPMVLCVRNMKDYDTYLKDDVVRTVFESACSILVPHTEAESSLPQSWRPRAVFTGPILKPLPVDPVPIQLRVNAQGKQVVVITSGGGGHPDTTAFLRLCLEGVSNLRDTLPDLTAVLIPGPLFKDWLKLPAVSNVHILPFDSRFVDTCATADVVLAQAGYNSANELAYLGTPTLMVPAQRGFDDQFARAAQMEAEWPNIRTVPDPTPASIAATLREMLSAQLPRQRADAPEGAYHAAAHLLHLLNRI